jgi:hypothetical protein
MVKTVSTNFSLCCIALAGSACLVGCVDARGAYGEYEGRVVDANDTEVDGQIVSVLPDVDGEWLLAVRPNPNVVPEDRIIQFRATFDLTPVTENTGKIDVTAQPLRVDDRTAVGEAFEANQVAVASDATFDAPFVGTLPGEANPVVPGSNAAVDAVLLANIKSDQFLCGELTGTAGALPLEGTTWAAIRVTGDTLPAPIFRCDDEP